jgi:hypothetical protein
MPPTTPITEPIRKPATAACSVARMWITMLPVEIQIHRRCTTDSGLEIM